MWVWGRSDLEGGGGTRTSRVSGKDGWWSLYDCFRLDLFMWEAWSSSICHFLGYSLDRGQDSGSQGLDLYNILSGAVFRSNGRPISFSGISVCFT